MTSILPDSRIVGSVKVFDSQTGASSSCDAIVDTGSFASALPYGLLGAVCGTCQHASGPTLRFGSLAFHTMTLLGVVTEVVTEPHGGGGATTQQTNHGVGVHFCPIPLPFPFPVGAAGIIGYDVLDSLAVDIVKDAGRTRAYFVRRA